ncbi:MAG: hypothetical protein EOM90_13570 [Alphaproteobacteria bacterium]|nr:hypothetical protein [Alphaproteobacteria bacterium]
MAKVKRLETHIEFLNATIIDLEKSVKEKEEAIDHMEKVVEAQARLIDILNDRLGVWPPHLLHTQLKVVK